VDWIRSLRSQDTTHSRFLVVLSLTVLVLLITIFLSPVADSQLAEGARSPLSSWDSVVDWLEWQSRSVIQVSWRWVPTPRASGPTSTRHSARLHLLSRHRHGSLSGLIIAIPSTRLKGPYLAGMTLAFSAAISPIVQNFTSVTGG